MVKRISELPGKTRFVLTNTWENPAKVLIIHLDSEGNAAGITAVPLQPAQLPVDDSDAVN